MDDKNIVKILKFCDIKFTDVLPYQSGYRNRSYPVRTYEVGLVNLIVYKQEPGILARVRRADKVSGYLLENGFPSRNRLRPEIVHAQAGTNTKYAGIYNYLPGETIPWEAYTMDHIKALGMVMSNMHAELRYFKTNNLPDVADEYIEIVERMAEYFSRTGVIDATQTKLNLSIVDSLMGAKKRILQICKRLPGQQVLHMDFVRGNILFKVAGKPKESRFQVGKVVVSGILDFEKTGIGHPVLDIARTLAFLLVDCKYKTNGQARKYFLQSGYIKRGQSFFSNIIAVDSSGNKIYMLDELINLFLIYDFYKFLRHNPYESLADNEHFVRTRNLLLERGVIVHTDDRINRRLVTGV